MIRIIAKGTTQLTGPDALVEQPPAEEIQRRIEETPFRSEFSRLIAREDCRMGLIESRVQLDFHCADLGFFARFPDYAKAHGVRMENIVHPRSSYIRR